MLETPSRLVSPNPPRACPMCLADLVREERGNSIVYVCKMCRAVEISVRTRPSDTRDDVPAR
jgi:hypothetical protein